MCQVYVTAVKTLSSFSSSSSTSSVSPFHVFHLPTAEREGTSHKTTSKRLLPLFHRCTDELSVHCRRATKGEGEGDHAPVSVGVCLCKREELRASVLMQRLSHLQSGLILTETAISNKITRNGIVPSFKDSPRKPLRRRPSDSISLFLRACV